MAATTIPERDVPTHAIHDPGVTTAAVITLAAAAGQRHVISQISWSYDTVLATNVENLAVTDGGTDIFKEYVPVSTTAFARNTIHFSAGLIGSINSEVIVTLSAPTAGRGVLNITYTTVV